MWARILAAAAMISLLCAFGGGTPDSNYLPDNGQLATGAANLAGTYFFNTSFRDTTGKTLRANQSASAYSGCPVIIHAGQSNEGGEAPTSFTPTNASVIHNWNAFDGALYGPADPPLGSTSFVTGGGSGMGSVVFRIADALITAGATCVVYAPIAVGGTAIGEWAPGGLFFPRLLNTINRLNGRGFTTQYVIWGQGERDCTISTPRATYAASGAALFTSLPSSVNKIFVAKQTRIGAGAAPNVCDGTGGTPNLQAAQVTDLVNHSASPPVWAGPDVDSLTGSICSGSTACRQADGLHFSDNGNITRASSWQTALHASGSPF